VAWGNAEVSDDESAIWPDRLRREERYAEPIVKSESRWRHDRCTVIQLATETQADGTLTESPSEASAFTLVTDVSGDSGNSPASPWAGDGHLFAANSDEGLGSPYGLQTTVDLFTLIRESSAAACPPLERPRLSSPRVSPSWPNPYVSLSDCVKLKSSAIPWLCI
jgi:hypothetical protein